jgi:hypothetical protein
MHKFLVIAVAGLLVTDLGCRKTDCDAVYEHSFWENAEGVRSHMDGYKHILTVRIDENRGEDRGPNNLSVLHFKGTVVKSWKGDWKLSEKISFVHYVDYRASTTSSNEEAGETLFVFTNDHTNEDIALETGDFGYSTNVEQVLHCFFNK